MLDYIFGVVSATPDRITPIGWPQFHTIIRRQLISRNNINNNNNNAVHMGMFDPLPSLLAAETFYHASKK